MSSKVEEQKDADIVVTVESRTPQVRELRTSRDGYGFHFTHLQRFLGGSLTSACPMSNAFSRQTKPSTL